MLSRLSVSPTHSQTRVFKRSRDQMEADEFFKQVDINRQIATRRILDPNLEEEKKTETGKKTK